MKILFILSEFPYPAKNGVTIKTCTAINALRKHHQCDIISLSCDPERDSKKSSEICGINVVGLIKPNSRFVTHIRRILALITFKAPAVMAHYNKEMSKKISDAVNSNNYDVIIYDMISSIAYKKDIKAIHILSVNDAISLGVRRSIAHQKNFIKKIYYYFSYRSILRLEKKRYGDFDLVTLVSEKDKEYLQKICPKAKLGVIFIAVENKYFSDGQKKENKLFFNGSMLASGIKEGLFEFLEKGYRKVLNGIRDLEFIIIARHATDEQVKYIKNFPKVIFIDFAEDYASLLKKMKIMIVPDQGGTGLKNRVLQAFAAEVAVVGSEFALEGFKYENDIHAYCTNDAEGMADKIIELFYDDRKRENMVQSAKRLATENYSEEIIEKMWIDLIETKTRDINNIHD